MSMFANKISPDSGNPICPLKGCLIEIPAGQGEARMGADPLSMHEQFLNGVLAQDSGIIIVHKVCPVASASEV